MLTILIVTVFRAYSIDVQVYRNITLLDEDGRVVMSDVAYDGKMFVAGGTYRPKGAGDDYLDAALWTSEDGWTWDRLAHDHELFGGVAIPGGRVAHRRINSVYATPEGFLIFGFDTAPDGETRAAVWELSSGSVQARRAEGSFPDARSFQGYSRHGSVEIAVGSDQQNATVWRRQGDGGWSAQSFGPSGIVQLKSVTYQNGSWFVTGFDRSTDPNFSGELSEDQNYYRRDGAIWASADGASWTRVDGMAGIEGSQTVNDIEYSHGMWIAVGEDDAADEKAMDAAIWISDDGRRWRRSSSFLLAGVLEWQTMGGLVDAGDRLIAVGTELPENYEKSEPEGGVSMSREQVWVNAVWRIDLEPRLGSRTLQNVFRELISRR
ncbi:hypothetical protein [Rhodococcus sp. P14]|uniref:hypothetical protein n=1 Tax=Rhodococcus sp. P14 TaxID=450821 RepID=UPI0012F6E208|nr:hypothetical protein [Rhodococcus sp. P14]